SETSWPAGGRPVAWRWTPCARWARCAARAVAPGGNTRAGEVCITVFAVTSASRSAGSSGVETRIGARCGQRTLVRSLALASRTRCGACALRATARETTGGGLASMRARSLWAAAAGIGLRGRAHRRTQRPQRALGAGLAVFAHQRRVQMLGADEALRLQGEQARMRDDVAPLPAAQGAAASRLLQPVVLDGVGAQVGPENVVAPPFVGGT